MKLLETGMVGSQVVLPFSDAMLHFCMPVVAPSYRFVTKSAILIKVNQIGTLAEILDA